MVSVTMELTPRHVFQRDDPTLGLPQDDVYVEELRQRLKAGKYQGERDLLEPQSV